MDDDIGALGQKLFETWCTQARITAIPASPDKHGWDYFIQLPAPAGPHDAPERSCKVQVKTTTAGEPSASIKLSNWERMAKERIPWFLLHLVLDGVEAHGAYLVHVGEPQVALVLAKLRGLGREDLHRTRMALTASENDALANPFHESLRERLLSYMGLSEEAYVAEKSQWIKRAGYEDRPFTYTVTTTASNEAAFLSQMADWAVGLIDKLPLASIDVAETRFGITLPREKFAFTEGFFQFVSLPSVGSTIVTLTNRDRSDSVAIKCSTHIASKVVPFLPPEYERFRFVGEYMSMLVLPKDTGTAIRVHFDVPGSGSRLSLSEAARAYKALRLFALSPGAGLFATFASDGSSTLDLGPTNFDPDPEFQRFACVVEGASYIARHFDLDPEMKVDPAELLRQDFQVNVFAASLDRRIRDWGLKVHIDATEKPLGDSAAVVLGTVVNFGTQVVGTVFALVGTANLTEESDDGGGWSLGIDNPEVRICYQRVATRAEWDGSVFPSKIDEAVHQLDSEGIAIVGSMKTPGGFVAN